MLYADLGAGFSENSVFELRTGPGGQVDRCLKLPRAVRAFRLDPADGPCLLTINAFSIQEVSRIEAGLRLMYGNLRQVRGSGIPLPVIARRVWQVFRRGGWAVVKQKLLHYPPFLEPASPYRTWILANDTLADSDRENMRRDISALAQKPLFSIVMPVYNTPAELLRRAIDSVTAQLYPNWQLCMANDASTDTRVAAILDEYAERDSRILVCHRRTNGHICAASNSAIELATGDFIALLDHDDELAEHALYWVARELAEHPEADVIYSDEDKIDAEGQRYDPHFKCDWNPDLFLSQNYMSHLAVYRRSLVTAVGGFREGFEGSQDYDLALRCTARTSAERIRHIPKVLYHWRAVQGSTALATKAKDYATDAGLRALRDHLARHERLEVEAGPWPTTYRVRYPLPSAPPRVTLIIPTRDGRDIIETCIESILTKTTYPNYEIVIIDNQSTDPNTLSYLEGLDQSGRARVLRYDGPFNFSAINNYAVEHTDGQLVGLINNDIEVISPGWLSEMVSLALRPDAGAIGAKLYYADGSIQHAGVILGIGGVAGHSHKYSPGDVPGYFCRLGLVQNQSAVTAACLVVRRELYTRIGGFNERDLPVAFNDVDFCLRLREAGYRNVWTPHAELYHYESISRGMENTPEKQLRFRKEVEYMLQRWGDVLDRDPYYSPHLTRTREDFSLEPA